MAAPGQDKAFGDIIAHSNLFEQYEKAFQEVTSSPYIDACVLMCVVFAGVLGCKCTAGCMSPCVCLCDKNTDQMSDWSPFTSRKKRPIPQPNRDFF